MMELVKFTEDDFKSLVLNLDSPWEMMIWAGTKYTYPLTLEQLVGRMNQKINGKTKNHLFSLSDSTITGALGYIEIEIIDENKKLGSIQSVMIFKNFRGLKYSNTLLNLACSYSFETLKLKELELKVFSSNSAAISCYRKAGFIEKEILDRIDPITGKSFQLIVMKKENSL